MRVLFTAVLAATGLFATCAIAGAPLRITFQNASALTVASLEVRSAGGHFWGSNQLSGKGLAPGAKSQFLLADGANKCVVEMQFATSDGKVRQLQVVLCANPVFTFHGP